MIPVPMMAMVLMVILVILTTEMLTLSVVKIMMWMIVVTMITRVIMAMGMMAILLKVVVLMLMVTLVIVMLVVIIVLELHMPVHRVIQYEYESFIRLPAVYEPRVQYTQSFSLAKCILWTNLLHQKDGCLKHSTLMVRSVMHLVKQVFHGSGAST